MDIWDPEQRPLPLNDPSQFDPILARRFRTPEDYATDPVLAGARLPHGMGAYPWDPRNNIINRTTETQQDMDRALSLNAAISLMHPEEWMGSWEREKARLEATPSPLAHAAGREDLIKYEQNRPSTHAPLPRPRPKGAK